MLATTCRVYQRRVVGRSIGRVQEVSRRNDGPGPERVQQQ